jgi:hypothetical protein
MCDTQARNAIMDVVGELTNQGKLFSAFDVTKMLRAKGINEPHRSVKQEVHSMYRNLGMPTNYERELVHLANNDTAWVYYPEGADPQTYDPNALPGKNMTSTDPVATDLLVQRLGRMNRMGCPTPTDAGPPYIDMTDRRGRLLVRKALVQSIGLKPYDKAVVYVSPTQVAIEAASHTVNFAVGKMKIYKVDRDNAVRISAKTLKTLGLVGTAFKVEKENNRLIIEKA